MKNEQSNKKILPLQNEINPFVVVWIVPMQPQLSKTAMKGKMSKKLEVACKNPRDVERSAKRITNKTLKEIYYAK